jgi:hypothetical protein
MPYSAVMTQLKENFGYTDAGLEEFAVKTKKELLDVYEQMQLCRLFENACNQVSPFFPPLPPLFFYLSIRTTLTPRSNTWPARSVVLCTSTTARRASRR